jgi:hypothetical protein
MAEESRALGERPMLFQPNVDSLFVGMDALQELAFENMRGTNKSMPIPHDSHRRPAELLPVTKLAAEDARKRTGPTRSSVVPHRFRAEAHVAPQGTTVHEDRSLEVTSSRLVNLADGRR